MGASPGPVGSAGMVSCLNRGMRLAVPSTMIARRLPEAALTVGMAAAMLVLWAPAAGAHAAPVSSDPEAGSRLAAAPGVVRIRFSEPLILDLSSMAVIDPTGRRWPRSAASGREMSVILGTSAQGVYLVEWKTVSPLDGHTLRGELRFGVGVSPGEVGDTVVGPQVSDLVLGIARATEDAALLLVVGAVVIGLLERRGPPLSWVRVRRTLAWSAAVALVGGVVVVLGESLLASPRPSATGMFAYLSAGPGAPRLARLGAETLIAAGTAFGVIPVVGVGVVTALTALAAAGHAAAVVPQWWGIGVGSLHLVAAGVWAGGIGALALLRPPGGWRGGEARDLLARFTPLAVPAFLATAIFGGLRGVQELAGLVDLLATSYGQVLLVKMTAVALMVSLSWRAWRRRRPLPRLESAIGLLAIMGAALLAAYPLPPRRAAEAALVAQGSNAAFPQSGDLTLGANTGEVLVGLTLRPGRPGQNQALVYLLPTGGEEPAVGLGASLAVDDRPATSLGRCGTACRNASVLLEGGETIRVAVEGVKEMATFHLPALPAPDGAPLVDLLSRRMGTLRSLRYEEMLAPADPPVRSTVEMVAPDRIRVVIHTSGREQIRIGDTQYLRDTPGEPWRASASPVIAVPGFVWDYPDKVGVYVVAEEEMAGTRTSVVAFFVNAGDNLPIWYRLWVDGTGLVHRAEMRAQGHFMDHVYTAFDAPITIVPPAG